MDILEERILLDYWDTSNTYDIDHVLEAGLDPNAIDGHTLNARVWTLRKQNILHGRPHPIDMQPHMVQMWYAYALCKGKIFDAHAPPGHPFHWLFTKMSPCVGTTISQFLQASNTKDTACAQYITCNNYTLDVIETIEREYRSLPENACLVYFVATFGEGDAAIYCVFDVDEISTTTTNASGLWDKLMFKEMELNRRLTKLVERSGRDVDMCVGAWLYEGTLTNTTDAFTVADVLDLLQ